MKLSYQDAVDRYGPIVNGVWTDKAKWCVIYHPPQWFSDQVVNSLTGFPCLKIYMNKDMVPIMVKALQLVNDRGLSHEIKTFDGCQGERFIRGSSNQWSIHSYGAGVDLNAHDNPLGGPVRWSNEFLETMEEAGFTLGAKFSRVDGMHFSLGY